MAEALNQETLEKYVKKHNWLPINEIAAPTGRQQFYLTPAGNVVIALYDLKGTFIGIGQPLPPPQTPLSAAGRRS